MAFQKLGDLLHPLVIQTCVDALNVKNQAAQALLAGLMEQMPNPESLTLLSEHFGHVATVLDTLAALFDRVNSQPSLGLVGDGYAQFLQGSRTYIARFAKRLEVDCKAGNPLAMAFLDDLAGLAFGLFCLILECQPDTPEAWRQVVMKFLPEIPCHFGNPSQSDGNGGAEHE